MYQCWKDFSLEAQLHKGLFQRTFRTRKATSKPLVVTVGAVKGPSLHGVGQSWGGAGLEIMISLHFPPPSSNYSQSFTTSGSGTSLKRKRALWAGVAASSQALFQFVGTLTLLMRPLFISVLILSFNDWIHSKHFISNSC